MKFILSRKGFDSKSGGYPSPIFPDGSLISLPIPAHEYVTGVNFAEETLYFIKSGYWKPDELEVQLLWWSPRTEG